MQTKKIKGLARQNPAKSGEIRNPRATGKAANHEDVAQSSFAQSQNGSSTTQGANMMVGLAFKTVTMQGPYSANQSSAATSDVIEVDAEYAIWDDTLGQAVDVNSTNFKHPQ